MSDNKSYRYAFLTVALLLVGSVVYAVYEKYSTTDQESISYDSSSIDTVEPSEQVNVAEFNSSEQEVEESDITGKVISVNTNAAKKTFIKVRGESDNSDYILLTSINPEDIDINMGDIVSFPNNLERSQNDAYYFLNDQSDYTVVEKNKEVSYEMDTVDISDIEPSMEGREVKLSGMISDLNTSQKGHSFFKVSNGTDTIKGVLFNSENKQLGGRLELLNEYADTSKSLQLEGQISIYKGDLQIIVSKAYT